MSEKTLEDFIDNGNPEQIDDILTRIEGGEDEAAILATLESGDTGVVAEPAADTTLSQEESPAAEAAPVETQPVVEAAPAQVEEVAVVADAEPVVLAKDGKNEIPYSVLEQERANGAHLKHQLEELSRKNALLEGQLTEADIKPKELPENVRFSAEQIADFESYGEIGEAVAILAQQNAMLQEQLGANNVQPVAEGVAEPETNPLALNPDTARWAQTDAHWNVLEGVNGSLDSDPAWAGRSLTDRIPEIVRRTKAALGEKSDPSIDAAAAAALAGSLQEAPTSLTEVGGEVLGQEKPITQQLEDGDITDVQAYLEKETAKGRSMDDVLTSLLPT